ncbi:hypothetical protein OE810_06525 [Rhodobacteraceae bacterium XHP0102]|nr:hypothetical protein [Rhodobacteraceae bacterium XHP0102]
MRFGSLTLGAAALILLPNVQAAKADIADLVRGQSVSLSAVVDRIPDEDEIVLKDATGQILVYLGPAVQLPQIGETVVVEGVVDDDGPREINATRLIRADGSSQTLRGYE